MAHLMRLYRLTETWERQRNDAPAYTTSRRPDPVLFITAAENGAQKLREGR
jgi:hypothetical protein